MQKNQTYTKKMFLEDVSKEAKALKKHATKLELGKLDIETFDPDVFDKCIYGQMTGYCRSTRAFELIMKCCKKVIRNDRQEGVAVDGMFYIEYAVNGKPSKQNLSLVRHFSMIEAYILTPFAKNKNLIDYLKNKRKELVLN